MEKKYFFGLQDKTRRSIEIAPTHDLVGMLDGERLRETERDKERQKETERRV